MRTKDKIEKYLDRLCKKYNGEVVESEHSRYYKFNNRILRVSNHVAKNSDGSISIVFDSFDEGNYILCSHNTGNIFILNYEHLKSYVKNFIITCYLFGESIYVIPANPSNLQITSQMMHNNFSKNQIVTIKGWLSKNNKLRKLL